MKKRTYILPLLIILITACSDYSADDDQDSPKAAGPKKEFPVQESWDSNITLTKEGKLVAEIKAGYIANYAKKNETHLQDSLVIDFYDSDGEHSSVLTADYGVVDNNTKNLVATGNVIVVSDSGVVLRSTELKWDNKREKIVSDVPVTITTETDTLVGDNFVSSPDLSNYEIRNARGRSTRGVSLDR
ncbi:MAG: LPS export ABC transporter periplasmic protein LptC [Calditrichota bacterium]